MYKHRFLYLSLVFLVFSCIALFIGCSDSDGSGKASPETFQEYTISGKISGERISGVNIILSGVVSAATETGDKGNYSFADLPDGTYSVAPSGPFWYAYEPASQAVVVNGENVSGINFTSSAANALKNTISGFITFDRVPLQGVFISLSGANSGSAATDPSGYYNFPGLIDGVYTLTPVLDGYSFTPTSRTIRITGGRPSSINFTVTTGTGLTRSNFNGIYDVNLIIGNCSRQYFTEVIGNDSNRREDFGGGGETQYYLFIPVSGNSSSYSYESDGDLITRKITISDKLIMVDESWEDDANSWYSGHFILTFSDDYDSFSISGHVDEADPTACDGPVSGTGKRR